MHHIGVVNIVNAEVQANLKFQYVNTGSFTDS